MSTSFEAVDHQVRSGNARRQRDERGRLLPGHKNLYSGRPLAERFWEKVERRGPDDCWIWNGATDWFGYGRINNSAGTNRAHRVSWELHFGPIPEGLHCLHKCDNPSCCNPKHLELGDDKKNISDAAKRGRTSRGEHRPLSKLTAAQVREIRQRYASGGVTHQELADDYPVSRRTIGKIVNRKRWRWLK